MRILGLDLGTKRIGVAISDGLGIIAQGIETIQRKDETHVFKCLRDIVDREGVREIVVGLPLNMNGTMGPKARDAEAFAEKIRAELKIPAKLWDERLTSLAAERLMIQADVSRSKRKQKADKIAAQLILQGYLDSIDKTEI